MGSPWSDRPERTIFTDIWPRLFHFISLLFGKWPKLCTLVLLVFFLIMMILLLTAMWPAHWPCRNFAAEILLCVCRSLFVRDLAADASCHNSTQISYHICHFLHQLGITKGTELYIALELWLVYYGHLHTLCAGSDLALFYYTDMLLNADISSRTFWYATHCR